MNVTVGQRKSNADTPTLISNPNKQNGSFVANVVYDSNRKVRENLNTSTNATAAGIEENRLKQASSLSPTRMIQDMSRQDASQLMNLPQGGTLPNQSTNTVR